MGRASTRTRRRHGAVVVRNQQHRGPVLAPAPADVQDDVADVVVRVDKALALCVCVCVCVCVCARACVCAHACEVDEGCRTLPRSAHTTTRMRHRHDRATTAQRTTKSKSNEPV
jgi:hypothetical protein